MLQKIRDNLQGTIAKVIVGIIMMTTRWKRMRAAIYASQGTTHVITTTLSMWVMKRRMIDIIEAAIVVGIVPLAPRRGIMTIRIIRYFRGFHLWEI